MKWSKEVPTATGWYWYRENQYMEPRIVDFILLGLTEFVPIQQSIRNRSTLETYYNPVGEWAGPLEPPQYTNSINPKE